MTTAAKTMEDTLVRHLRAVAPEKVDRKWLDAHADDIDGCMNVLGATAVSRALGMSVNSLRSWRQWRGRASGPGASTAVNGAGPNVVTGGDLVLLGEIDNNPWQPRKTIDPDYLETLAASIDQSGLLQTPVGRRMETGRVQLAFGHQRVEGIRLLSARGKWGDRGPVVIRDLTDQQMALFALEENAKRKDINPLEQVQGYQKVVGDGLLNVTELAESLGLARSTVSNNLRILNLPKVALNHFGSGELGAHAARELLAYWASDHCHEKEIIGVLWDINKSGGAPDWRVQSVREKMRDQVLTRYRQEWRPLRQETGNSYSYSYYSAYSPPTFDVKAFTKEFPTHVHQLPSGQGSMAWTCNVKEWQRRQSAATREAGKAVKDGGPTTAAMGRRSREEYLLALERDPVVKAIKAGEDLPGEPPRVSQETRPATDDPKAAEYKRVNGWVFKYLLHQGAEAAGQECDHADTPDDCPGCSAAEGEAVLEYLLSAQGMRDRLDLELLTDRQIESAIERAIKVYEGGDDEPDTLVPVPAVDGVPADVREKLGSRAGFIPAQGARPSFLKKLSGYEVPHGFALAECMERCTWGAVYAERSFGGAQLHCSNATCYQGKVEDARERFVQFVDKRKQAHEAREAETIAVFRSFPQVDQLRTAAMALMAAQRHQSVKLYGDYGDDDLRRERVSTTNVRMILGIKDEGRREPIAFSRTYGELIDPAIREKLATMEASELQELIVNLAAYTVTAHDETHNRYDEDDDEEEA